MSARYCLDWSNRAWCPRILPLQASLFIKQAFWRHKGFGGAANSVRLGRFEFIDGAEVMPKDPTLAWMKRERIAHRLIGNFGWSHVQRSFDGGELVRNTPGLNITTTAFGVVNTTQTAEGTGPRVIQLGLRLFF